MTEIILIIVILFITIGMGKLPQIASGIGRLRSNFNKGLDTTPPVRDLTPDQSGVASESERKPGKFEHKVEDANVDDAH